ncbi:Rieske (2Fe-2S) domain protein [Methylocella silvestris BL2]|uniref:Rieske (2Fe-2S) domain protein n=1 Tax=Methylocella silvestris (strain DSM 15510 / CIP 108128 / LMG 27833 / NCIMB 13906 / BL2) TaxID=395965 RepID=B8ESU2_METSB|nr:aromatic ring-hydroxylating dioxygenase subunit alpha [Methylocella silvestris]ACK50427.1 Rieske (2Fe-2S) domain protein [Methylocella silvestris BL2]
MLKPAVNDWLADQYDRVPYRLYSDQSVYDSEQKKIYSGPLWHFVGMEAELAKPNDFKTTFVGETPVVVTRDENGKFFAWVNRCSHRGALVCRERKGNSKSHACVYHQWSFDTEGNLTGVPFRRGVAGVGGYPKDFSTANHALKKLRVETFSGLIFATFNHDTPTLAKFLGPKVVKFLDRVCGKPLKLLGYHRQYIHGNWKLYLDNTRDPYHASLLHLFHGTFGLIRTSQTGVSWVDSEVGWHSIITAEGGSDDNKLDAYENEGLRTYQPDSFKLKDISLLRGRKEYPDPVTLLIMSVFPSLVMHQISNTLCFRQVLPKAPDQTELIWHYFGYVDDDAEMQGIRLKQMNLVGPGGLISMEDGEAIEIVQRATVGEGDGQAVLEMGGRDAVGADHLVTEGAIRCMWKGYREIMGL